MMTFDEWFNSTIGATETYGLTYDQAKKLFAGVWEAAINETSKNNKGPIKTYITTNGIAHRTTQAMPW